MHTGSDRESSACEDIDSIDPLARLLFREPAYRRDDIRTALGCVPWRFCNCPGIQFWRKKSPAGVRG